MKLLALASLFAAASAFAAPSITWSSLDSGGGTLTGGTFEISGTIAQPDACAPNYGDSLVITGGYWAVIAPTCDADFNNDGAVDFFDYLDFVDALSSMTAAADFNHDDSIDFFDYLDFVDRFSAGC